MIQAEKHRDLTMEQSFHDLEGEVITDEVLVEFRIEKISSDGKRTISVHRVVPYSKYEVAIVATKKDWTKVLERSGMNETKFIND
jgi:hypothetical protein